jgi:D-alanine-D-alanine ligase
VGRPLRVLHLAGSATDEFMAGLSLLYARDCLAATADPARYDVHLAYVSPDGSWRFPADLDDATLRRSEPLSLSEAVARLAALRIDVAVPQMFCLPGMTTYRSLLDAAGIRYVGNPAHVMAIGADKALARAVVSAAGVAVPAAEVLRAGQAPSLAPPVVVKPVTGDNSVGVTLVGEPAQFPAALAAAFAHGDRVLVESYVELGREVRCGLLDLDGRLVALPLEEYAVDPVTKPIRDHADKIGRADGGDLMLMAKTTDRAWPVDVADPVTDRVQKAARRAHAALGCRDYSLFDFRVDPYGRPWFLEASLYCSFARQSVLVTMAEAAGIPLEALFRRLVAPGAA